MNVFRLASLCMLVAACGGAGPPPASSPAAPSASSPATSSTPAGSTAGVAPAASSPATASTPACSTAGVTLSDAALVRKHREEQTVPFAVVLAARRVFEASHLVGCSTDQIAALLAQPDEKRPAAAGVMWVYVIHDGEIGVIRRLHVKDDRVTAIEAVPTL